MTGSLRRAWLAVAVLLPLGSILAAAVLIAARWPRYWAWVASEQAPLGWLESVLLVLCAVVAAHLALDALLTGLPARAPGVLAAGFTVLALDERFALHERLRDGLLAPAGVRVPLPWVGPGDFLLLGYALAGLAVLPLVLRQFRGDGVARALFLAGVALAALAVAADSVDPERLPLAVERAEQTVEELVELAGCTLLLLGLVRLHFLRLAGMTAPPAAYTGVCEDHARRRRHRPGPRRRGAAAPVPGGAGAADGARAGRGRRQRVA